MRRVVTRGPHRGAVSSFDRASGLGEVTAEHGEVLAFHCTAIADGSREIEAGTDVVFSAVPGRSGRWEAAQLLQR